MSELAGRRQMRPLVRLGDSGWQSRDGRWLFVPHLTDPRPHRWFAYLDGDDLPCNEGEGHTTLRESVAWAERWDATADASVMHDAAGPCEPGYHRAMPDGTRCRCGQVVADDARDRTQ